jgi:hypothetical protein
MPKVDKLEHAVKARPSANGDGAKQGAKPEPAPAAPRRGSLLLADVQRVLERFEAADRRRRVANLCEADKAAHEAEMLEAAAEEREAGLWLADLLLLFLRYARRHRPEALTAALAEALRPEIEPLALAVARLEGRE